MPDSPVPLSEHDLDFGPTLRGLREGVKVFGRYELVRMLGRGGMGVVWLARDSKLDLLMALKFLPENLVHDEVALDDLRRETRRCLKLTHQNIVHVFDLVDDAATAAIAMAYVEGRTLSALRLEKPNRVFEPAAILPWLQQVCEALEYAHTKAKIVHHDLKPGNIMLSREGEVKVMDFGISSSIGDSMSRVSKARQQSSGGGTLPYMSPQQLMGFPPGVSDDVYALGATLYELITGKPPFFRGSLESQIQTLVPPGMAVRRQELNVTGAAVIPEKWERLIAACLEKEAEKRPANAMAVWRSLNEGTGFSASPQAERPPPLPPLPPRQPPPQPPPPKLQRPTAKEEQYFDALDRIFRNKKPLWSKLRRWCLWWALGHALVTGLVCGLASLTESVSRNSVTVAEAAPHASTGDLAHAETSPASPGQDSGSLSNAGTSALKWLLITSLTAEIKHHEFAPAPAVAVAPPAAEAPSAGRVEWDKIALGRIGLLILKDDPSGGLFLFMSGLLGCLLFPVLHYLVLRPYYPWASRFAITTGVVVAVASVFIMLFADHAVFRTVRFESSYAWYGLIDDWLKLPLIGLFSGAAYAALIQAPAKQRLYWFITHVLGLFISGLVLGAAVILILPDPFFPVNSLNASNDVSNAMCFGLDFLAGAVQGLAYGLITALGWAILEPSSGALREAASFRN